MRRLAALAVATVVLWPIGASASPPADDAATGSVPPSTTSPGAEAASDTETETDPVRSGPRITLDRTEVRIDEPIIVTLSGFTSQQATVAVCGNLAKRGSEDCNMPQAQSERIRADEPETLTQIFVQEPPVACPCIVRALGTNGEFAIAPIDLVDHPIAPVVSPELGALVEVGVIAERVPTNLSGRIRTGLGAATRYATTVEVRNITTETLSNVTVRARISNRSGDDVAPMVFDVPGPIEPGQTWSQTVEVDLPAPFIGTYTWHVSAAGAGPTVDATTTADAVPAVLYTLLGILVLDIIVLVVRALLRRRRRRAARRPAASPVTGVHDDADHPLREPVGVG